MGFESKSGSRGPKMELQVVRPRLVCESCGILGASKADTRCAWCYGPRLQATPSEALKARATLDVLETMYTFEIKEFTSIIESLKAVEKLQPLMLFSLLERYSKFFSAQGLVTMYLLSSLQANELLEELSKMFKDKHVKYQHAFQHAVAAFTFDAWNIESGYPVILATYGRKGTAPQTCEEIWAHFEVDWRQTGMGLIHKELEGLPPGYQL